MVVVVCVRVLVVVRNFGFVCLWKENSFLLRCLVIVLFLWWLLLVMIIILVLRFGELFVMKLWIVEIDRIVLFVFMVFM